MFIIAQAFALHVRAGAYDAALASLRDALPSVTDPDAGTNYCYPEQVETWNAAAWRSTLEAVSKKTHEPIGTRDARVIGLVAGTGFGKTHALRIAPGLLRATHDVYVTYNMEQELAFDKAHARVAILMRVLMRALGASNLACAAGLEQLKGMEDQKDGLRKLLVHLFAHTSASNMHASTRHIFIGIDEVRLLGTDRVRESTSELSILVDALKNAGVRCTVVVSSLTEDVFHTSSGRGIERVSLPAVTSAVACEHVLAKLLPKRGRDSTSDPQETWRHAFPVHGVRVPADEGITRDNPYGRGARHVGANGSQAGTVPFGPHTGLRSAIGVEGSPGIRS